MKCGKKEQKMKEFEKKAEEYADLKCGKDNRKTTGWVLTQEDFQKGAEFGYNKKCEETFEMALRQIKHEREVVIERNEKLFEENKYLRKALEDALKRIVEFEEKIDKIRNYFAYDIPHELMNEATNKIWHMI